MKVLRTPDSRFNAIGDLHYPPNYVDIEEPGETPLRMHYFDEGPRGNGAVLMIHGVVTWAYLYRTVINQCARAGYRCVAPDLIGFGRSDKPAGTEAHTYERHVAWMLKFIDSLQLEGITLLCHDWGGLIGLRLVAEYPHRFARVIAANTSLPTGDRQPPEVFFGWLRLVNSNSEIAAGRLVQIGCERRLTSDEVAAYDAPFPSEAYMAGIRQLPRLVPIRPDDPASAANRAAWESLASFEKPFLTVFGEKDPFTAGGEAVFQHRIPGAAGRPHVILPNAGHFLQEDAGEELARITISFIGSQPESGP